MNQLTIGMIGVGGRGGLWRHWHRPEQGRSVVVAGADTNESYRETFRTEHGGNPFVTSDWQELLVREDLDAVAVCAPDFLHEEMVVAALEAGKHVFQEKPMAITIEGCDRTLQVWERSGKRLMVGHNMRYMTWVRTMKDIIQRGLIGEPQGAWCHHYVGTGGDWYFHDWHALRQNATSLLLQKACHDFDVMQWLLGQWPQKVSAFGAQQFFGGDRDNALTCSVCPDRDRCPEFQASSRDQCVFRQAVDVEDHYVVNLIYDQGALGSYTQNHFMPHHRYSRDHVIMGPEGVVWNAPGEDRVHLDTRRSWQGKWSEYSNQVFEMKPVRGGHGGADPEITEAFVNHVLEGQELVATPPAARMAVAAGCLAARSARGEGPDQKAGEPLEVPPLPAALADARP